MTQGFVERRTSAEHVSNPRAGAGCNNPGEASSEQAAEVVRNHEGGTRLRRVAAAWRVRGGRPHITKWTTVSRDGGGAKQADRRGRYGGPGGAPRGEAPRSTRPNGRRAHARTGRMVEEEREVPWRESGTPAPSRGVLAGPAGDGQGQEGARRRHATRSARSRHAPGCSHPDRHVAAMRRVRTGLEDHDLSGRSGSPGPCTRQRHPPLGAAPAPSGASFGFDTSP